MPNLKQRLIKAGTDFNYSEGVKVKALVAIAANEIVRPTGYSGPFIEVGLADATTPLQYNGRLMIAKHASPAGGYGVVLPWRLVSGVDTNAAAGVGSFVHLSDTPGAWAVATGTDTVIVGTVVSKHATTGAILFHKPAPG